MAVQLDPVPGTPGIPGILGIDHVGIAVSDLERALLLHREVFGLHELHREENREMGVAEVMLGGAGADAGRAQVQLLAPLGREGAVARFLERSGPGIQHLAYRVGNLDHASRVLREKGLRLIYDSARPGTRNSRINFVHPKDAGGVLIELVESAAAAAGDPGGSPG